MICFDCSSFNLSRVWTSTAHTQSTHNPMYTHQATYTNVTTIKRVSPCKSNVYKSIIRRELHLHGRLTDMNHRCWASSLALCTNH